MTTPTLAGQGRAVPVVGDLRSDDDVERAVSEAAAANPPILALSPPLNLDRRR